MATENVIHRPTFKKMFKAAFKNFFSNLKVFVPIILVLGLVMFGLNLGLEALIDKAVEGGGIVMWLAVLLVFVLTMLIGIMYTLSFVRAAMKINGDTSFSDCISYAWSKLKTGVALMLRVFWFVGKWALLIMIPLIIFAVYNSYLVASRGINVDEMNYESFSMMDELGTSVLRGEDFDMSFDDDKEFYDGGLLGIGDEPAMISEAVSGKTGLRSLVGNTVNYILGLMGVIFLFIGGYFIIRNSVFSMFSFYALVDSDGTSKEALKESIHMSIGNFWRIAGTVLGLNFLLALIFVAPLQIIKLMTLGGAEFVGMIILVLEFFVALLMGGVSVVFLANFFGILKKEEEMYEMYGNEA